jgi:ribonuclease Z
MHPLLHPSLINGRYGDPALYIETLFERRAILFDLGDISFLSPRKVQRIEQIFVSHTHIDHFIGFDRLLRLLVGRDKTVHLYGPTDFVAQVHHKLSAYRWNLIDRFACDLVFIVTEIDHAFAHRTARFRLKNGFAAEEIGEGRIADRVLHREAGFCITTAVLEHRTPCLAFAIEEGIHVNVWKNRLAEAGLPVGPWLRDLKRAVIEGQGDDHPIRIGSPSEEPREMPLSALRHVLTITPGQKIGYVTDAADTAANRDAIIELARNADLLFIEAVFLESDADLAVERAHLTTAAAGRIARAAAVRRIEPFHFSPRYADKEEQMLDEVRAAFTG